MVFNRLAFLGTLASGLAHEIKNPLSSLNLNIQLLKEDIVDTPENNKLHKKIEIIQRESIRLEDILNDFLRFAKRKEPQLCLENVHDIVNEIVVFLLPEARQSCITIRKEYNEKLPKIILDRNLIKQALLNLIINSEQAMPNGGELIIATSLEGNNVKIDVIDTGVGIKPENVEKIFDLYYSTKSEGTGLGLATAKQIIEDHNGFIRVETEEGKGCSFSIVLPISET